ncbi:hypothetical protein L6452_29308 [Arctium lappa]|uniref:Uncharacterized protein n=1 Tax=Arctium lappa TaxID=4217 RepID=A0ACB8ZHH6_ARCLA|nr:hypothetical protein L6452_29308 [Arctium lappa]
MVQRLWRRNCTERRCMVSSLTSIPSPIAHFVQSFFYRYFFIRYGLVSVTVSSKYYDFLNHGFFFRAFLLVLIAC